MHIVIVSPYYAPAWTYGGPPKVLSAFAKEFIRKGHTVSVITTDALDERRNPVLYEEHKNIRIYRFKLFSNILAYKTKFFYVPDLFRQTKHILDTADCVLFSDVRSILSWQIFDYLSKKGIRYGVFAFGQIPHGSGWKSWIKKVFDALWVRRFITNASWCFAQTKHEQDMFHLYFHKKLSDIYLSLLPIDRLRKQGGSSIHFSQYGINKQDFVVLFVGRFHILKGVDTLLKACIPLLYKNSKVKLVLIGRDDGILDDLRRMVPDDLKKSILFPGAVYGNTVSLWYKRAQCFAFTPRFYEETSTAALEALSYGCPVVTVPQSDIPFLMEYNAGVIVPNTIPAIRKAVWDVCIHSTMMEPNAQKLITDHYNAKKVASRLLSILQLV